jgi:hypothetical protein
MTDTFQKFLGVMVFYIFLSYILGPLAFYYLGGSTLKSAGYGFVAGSALSIVLWFLVGQKLILPKKDA